MSGRYVLALLFLPLVADAKPKHVVIHPSYGEINQYSKHPCEGELKKKVVAEVWKRVLKAPQITVLDNELRIRIGNEEVAADEYGLDENNVQSLNPITGYWRVDEDTSISISVRREVNNIKAAGSSYFKMVMTAFTVRKFYNTPNYCFEQWIGQSEVR